MVWELIWQLLMPLLFILANYWDLACCRAETDNGRILQMEIIKCLVYATDSFVAAALDGIQMSKIANVKIVSGTVVLFVPMPKSLNCWIEDLGSLAIVSKTLLYPFLANSAFYCGQEDNWTCVDFDVPFRHRLWCTGYIIGLADKQMNELDRESSWQFLYHERAPL